MQDALIAILKDISQEIVVNVLDKALEGDQNQDLEVETEAETEVETEEIEKEETIQEADLIPQEQNTQGKIS